MSFKKLRKFLYNFCCTKTGSEEATKMIAHVAAIYLNPLTGNFTGDRKKELDRSSIDIHWIMKLLFYETIRRSTFCGHKILTGSVFVTQLSSNAGTSVWRILSVRTNRNLMSYITQLDKSRENKILCISQCCHTSYMARLSQLPGSYDHNIWWIVQRKVSTMPFSPSNCHSPSCPNILNNSHEKWPFGDTSFVPRM